MAPKKNRGKVADKDDDVLLRPDHSEEIHVLQGSTTIFA